VLLRWPWTSTCNDRRDFVAAHRELARSDLDFVRLVLNALDLLYPEL